MKPRIGITCAFGEATPDHYSLSSLYVDAVAAAGGLPLVLPAVTSSHFREIARCIDGLLLPGGGDVDPAYFGEEPRIENGRIDPVADAFEIGLIREFLKTGRPILGVCRGMQVLNVAAGGDLHQDIRVATGSPLQHVQQAPGWHGTHEITLSEGSLLRAVLKEERLRVNTFHHQAVRRVAPGFVASAAAADGIIEAIEKEGDAFVLGVQWHPERMLPQAEASQRLFSAFVNASSNQP
jgi:putative glutamine amidotransferase